MQADIVNPRRAARVPLCVAVEIRHRFVRWEGETEDLGPRGCRIVSPRPLDPGRDVEIALRLEPLGRTVTATGKVAWSRAEAPARLGVAFERSGTERGWFEALVAKDAAAQRAAAGVPDRLARSTRLSLGGPPAHVVDFSPTELELLRRVGSGVTLDALVRSFGPELHDRTRGALFGLVARRFVVLDGAAPAGVARWRAILPDEEHEEAEAPPRLVRWA